MGNNGRQAVGSGAKWPDPGVPQMGLELCPATLWLRFHVLELLFPHLWIRLNKSCLPQRVDMSCQCCQSITGVSKQKPEREDGWTNRPCNPQQPQKSSPSVPAPPHSPRRAGENRPWRRSTRPDLSSGSTTHVTPGASHLPLPVPASSSLTWGGGSFTPHFMGEFKNELSYHQEAEEQGHPGGPLGT